MGSKKGKSKLGRRASTGSYISRKEARGAIDLYCKVNPKEKIRSVFLGKNKLLALLEQEDCQGLRIYLGAFRNSPPQTDLVVVGADQDGSNILERDLILAKGMPCPPDCDDDGDL